MNIVIKAYNDETKFLMKLIHENKYKNNNEIKFE